MTDIKIQSDPVLRKSISKKNKVAIIAVGAIEQHGAHLPVSTDSDIAGEIAKKISEKHGYLLIPTVNYGVSYEHAPFFNLSIRESTLRTILTDLCSSLLSNNIRIVFIINGHHGNQNSIKNLDLKLKKISKSRLCVFPFSYWHFMEEEFDHAGFVETSLMLAISKNVKMGLAKKGLITDGMKKSDIARIERLAKESFPKAIKNGIWGDPRGATKKDGQRILAQILKNLGKKCQTCLTEHSS